MELSGVALDNPAAGGGETILSLEYSGNPDYGYTGALLKCPTLPTHLLAGDGLHVRRDRGPRRSPVGSRKQAIDIPCRRSVRPRLRYHHQGQSTKQVVTEERLSSSRSIRREKTSSSRIASTDASTNTPILLESSLPRSRPRATPTLRRRDLTVGELSLTLLASRSDIECRSRLSAGDRHSRCLGNCS